MNQLVNLGARHEASLKEQQTAQRSRLIFGPGLPIPWPDAKLRTPAFLATDPSIMQESGVSLEILSNATGLKGEKPTREIAGCFPGCQSG